MTLTQLNPTIPLRSDKASGECIAVIDYSIEHDLMWVVIDDATGQVWTVPNKDVRAYANYSAGRNLKPPPADNAAAVLKAFAAQWLAQPGATQRLLAACLTEEHILEALHMLAEHPAGLLQEGTASWLPDFMEEAKP